MVKHKTHFRLPPRTENRCDVAPLSGPMRFLRLSLALVLGAILSACSSVPVASWRVTVAATDADRAGVVVAVPLPAGGPRNLTLTGPAGNLPVQIDADGTARFVVAEIKAGVAPEFTLAPTPVLALAGAVQTEVTADRVRLSVRGGPLLDYWTKEEPLPNDQVDRKYLRSGHIHPLFSPGGKLVSSSYPLAHLHHHGIWMPWTKTTFQGREPDFWNMGKGTGTVRFAALERAWSGPVHGGFASRHEHIDLSAPSPVKALDETWEVTVYDVPGFARPVRIFDLVSTMTCATSDPLILPQYHYGGMGYRGNEAWLGKDQAFFLTSEGETDRVKANHQRMRWCHVGGRVDGAFTGVAVLGHPGNFRAPQPVRVHPTEPYVSFVAQQLGEFAIKPGEPYVARFRFVVMDGEPDARLIEALWQGYARPTQAAVVAR